jgi:molecular chaperone IbpA
MAINKIPFFDPFSFPDLTKSAIGFDSVFKKLQDVTESLPKIPTYPPYNIRKIGEDKYVIEVAVAGFGKQDIELELHEGVLTVKGSIASDDTASELLFKGIADRAFTRKFTLADSVEVKNADLINGMLKIWLERFVPEEKKPKKININEDGDDSKQFLAERR